MSGGGGGFVISDVIGVRSPRIQITIGFYRLDHGHAGILSCSCTIPLYPSALYNSAFPSRISSQESKACRISRLNISFQVYIIADTSISFAKTAMPRAYYSAVSCSSQGVWMPSLFLSLVSGSGASGCLDIGSSQAGRLRHTNTKLI